MHLVDLEECCIKRIRMQNSDLIQPRTSSPKFENNAIANFFIVSIQLISSIHSLQVKAQEKEKKEREEQNQEEKREEGAEAPAAPKRADDGADDGEPKSKKDVSLGFAEFAETNEAILKAALSSDLKNKMN